MASHRQNRTRAGRASRVSIGNEARVRRHASLIVALAALLGATPLAASAAPPERSAEGPWIKGRILVMPKPGLSSDALAKILRVHGGKARRVGGSNLHIIDLPPQASEKAVAAVLARNPHLEFAELDELVAPDLATNDPYMGSAWHLPKIGAPTAWDASQGSGVTIAILDSGVDAAHPDLKERLVAGWNFYAGNSDTMDVYGHGTKVAGAAAAVNNNGLGISSVAGQASIMPIRVTGTDGYGSVSAIAQGITYAADKGARVANASFGVAGYASVQSAAQYMKNAGGLVFVSAGNQSTDPGHAPTSSLIAVSATDSNDNKASFSNYGDWVSLSGPGTSIYSTVKGGGYGAVNGTSFSSPVSAGVAALVMSAKPDLSSTEVETILFASARDLGAAGKDPVYGHGRVDAVAAVQAALENVGTIDAQGPTASISEPVGSSTVSGLVAVNVNAADNVGVARVELRVNGSVYATDTVAPYAFSWDSVKVTDGGATLEAVAFDAANNSGKSASVLVNVANASAAPPPTVDGTAPTVSISNPGDGATVSGTVFISTSASDNTGSTGIEQQLLIDGKLVMTALGGRLSYDWNTRKTSAGAHTITVVAKDKAGNSAMHSVRVNVDGGRKTPGKKN